VQRCVTGDGNLYQKGVKIRRWDTVHIIHVFLYNIYLGTFMSLGIKVYISVCINSSLLLGSQLTCHSPELETLECFRLYLLYYHPGPRNT